MNEHPKTMLEHLCAVKAVKPKYRAPVFDDKTLDKYIEQYMEIENKMVWIARVENDTWMDVYVADDKDEIDKIDKKNIYKTILSWYEAKEDGLLNE